MRIAYCIIAHRNNKILRECIRVLSEEEDNSIFIHIDEKSNINNFKEYDKKVTFVDKRISVNWGEYSQIEATLQLLRQTSNKVYDYIFLLSGECLPVKNNEKIKKFLEENKGKQFVAQDIYFKNPDKRVKYKYTKYHFNKNKNFRQKLIVKMYEGIKYFNKNPYYIELPKIYKGTNWFGITNELKEYILEYVNKNDDYLNAFKYSFCADEIFFHTIIFNSKYKEDIYIPNDKSNICYQALRYIDWKSGPEYPKLLDEGDFNKIRKTECLFARKFSENLNIQAYRREMLGED